MKRGTMKILGLDFETTGLNSHSERVIEIGAVVWDVERKKPLALMSELVKPENFTNLTPEIIDITGIDDDCINDYGVDGKEAFIRLLKLINSCDYVMAHNANFDRAFFEAEMRNYEIECDFNSIQWVDTYLDIEYPKNITTRKLTYLAAEHGIVNTYAHRALFDVLTMLNVFKNYDVDDVIARSKSPKISAIAQVSYDDRDKAKNMGFHWNREKKVWFKEMKECDLQKIEFPFEVIVNSLTQPMI